MSDPVFRAQAAVELAQRLMRKNEDAIAELGIEGAPPVLLAQLNTAVTYARLLVDAAKLGLLDAQALQSVGDPFSLDEKQRQKLFELAALAVTNHAAHHGTVDFSACTYMECGMARVIRFAGG